MSIIAPPVPRSARKAEIFYPDSDGEPMAENTLQYEWIEKIKGGCEALFAGDPEVFVAGDLFWYAVKGRPDVRLDPDTLVAFRCPKGNRGSYKQWEEGGTPPQVVFEVLSPGNRLPEMLRKFSFYDHYGVEEYYIYDPDTVEFHVALRQEGVLTPQDFGEEFLSPRLGVRFSLPPDSNELIIYRPDGERFKSYLELIRERDAMTVERDTERARAERLRAKLRELGVEPD